MTAHRNLSDLRDLSRVGVRAGITIGASVLWVCLCGKSRKSEIFIFADIFGCVPQFISNG